MDFRGGNNPRDVPPARSALLSSRCGSNAAGSPAPSANYLAVQTVREGRLRVTPSIFDGSTALLIVDMLNDFVRPDGALLVPKAEAIIPAIERARRAARGAGATLVYLCDAHRKDDPEFGEWPPHAVAGTQGARVVDELVPGPDDVVIAKRRFSGFFGTDLDLHLRERGIGRIILCGVLTDICIYHTAADAHQHGYEVAVIRNGVAAATDEEHGFALRQMERLFGTKLLDI
jgi:nicotinamidase-related amidase